MVAGLAGSVWLWCSIRLWHHLLRPRADLALVAARIVDTKKGWAHGGPVLHGIDAIIWLFRPRFLRKLLVFFDPGELRTD